VAEAGVAGRRFVGVRERGRGRDVELELRRFGFGDHLAGIPKLEPAVLLDDVELALERGRGAERDLRRVVEEGGDPAAGVAAVRRVGRAVEAPRDHDVAVHGERGTVARSIEGGAMEEFFVWVTTRRIKDGSLDDLRQAWEP